MKFCKQVEDLIPELVNEKGEKNENPNWLDLPDELLEEVQRKLALVDHLHFGGVCCSWRSSRAIYREHRHRHPPPQPQLPWLLMDYLGSWPPRCKRTFLCLSVQKKYKLTLRDLSFDKCIGSTAGSWLVMQHHVVMAPIKHYLFNPFTKALIWLPKNLSSGTISIAFSSDPSDPQSSAVIVPHHQSACSLVYKKSGSDLWCSYTLEGDDWRLQEIAAVGKKFYSLTTKGRFVEINLELDPISIVRHDSPGSVRLQRQSNEHIYLVESGGDLLIVVESCPRRANCYFEPLYDLYKIDSDCSTLEGNRKIPSDRLLFLAPNGSFSLPAKEHGVEEEKIYWGGYRLAKSDKATDTCFRCSFNSDAFCHIPVWVRPEPFYEERKDFEGRNFFTYRNVMRWAFFAMMWATLLMLPFVTQLRAKLNAQFHENN